MKQIFWAMILLGLIGCGGISRQYLLSAGRDHTLPVAKRTAQIGVDKITVPGYLEENRIAVQKPGGEISYRDEGWAVPTSKSLTSSLIRSLQKRFSNPDVYLFPWDVEREQGIRVKVMIHRFIYSEGKVILEASYFIKRIGSSHKRSYLFTTEIPSAEETSAIVQTMDGAFAKLTEAIGRRM